MKYRKLRIAFSAVCGILCMLLIALWVRSYWLRDEVHFQVVPSFGNNLILDRGRLELLAEPIEPEDRDEPWPPSNDDSRLITVYTDEAYDSGWVQDDETLSHNLGFDAFTYPMGVRLRSVPFWFVTLVCIIAAALPWMRWRFSLRTLLIGMTVIAALMGAAVWLTR